MKRHYLYLITLSLFMACHKDTDTVISVIEIPDPPETLITTRMASITDTLSLDAGNTLQFFAGKDYAFAQGPICITEGTLIRRDRELIQLNTTDDVFYKVIALIENNVNYIDWSIPTLKTLSGQSSMNAAFDLEGAGALILPANTLEYADGNLYSGSFTVSWALFDPETTESRFIPSYTALKNDGQLAQILPKFCLYLTIKADDGSILKPNPDASIELNTSSEATWFFDSKVAAWRENGSADKIEVSANGYYLVGNSVSQTRVSGNLQINGSPAPHYPLTILYAGQQRKIYTTNSGSWAILLPAETSCVASVKLPCGDEQQVSFDVPNEPSFEMPVSVQSTEVINSFVKGVVRGCGAEVIVDPLLIIKGSYKQFYFPSESEIGLFYPTCTMSSMELQAIDQENQESGPGITWDSRDTIDIHSAFACSAAKDEYLFLEVAGDRKMYWDMSSAYTIHDRVLIETNDNAPDVNFQVFISGAMVGNYEDSKLNILFEDMQLGTRGFSLNCPTATSGCGFTKFTITHFPTVSGQWIRGHFEGRFWIKTFQPLTAGYRDVSGDFQVYREF